jgi:hypothetical protein
MTMAVCRTVQTNATPEQYDSIFEKLSTGSASTASRTLHIAAVGEDGKIRVVEVWDSRSDAEAFGEAVRAAREELGIAEPASMSLLEVHHQV